MGALILVEDVSVTEVELEDVWDDIEGTGADVPSISMGS
jgi:hypothetical protein